MTLPFARVLCLASLLLVTFCTQAQIPSVSFLLDVDATAVEHADYDGIIVGSGAFVSEDGRTVLAFQENEGLLSIPSSVSALFSDANSFEIEIDFKAGSHGSSNEVRPLLNMRVPCSDWYIRCPGLGLSFWASDDTSQVVILTFADGKEGEVAGHPASSFDDNIKWLGRVSKNEWHNLKLIVNFANRNWTLAIDDDSQSGPIDNENSPGFLYDMDAILEQAATNPIIVGGSSESNMGIGEQPMSFDQISFFVPSTVPSILTPALNESLIADEVLLSWTALNAPSSYEIEIDNNEDFSSPEWSGSVLDTSASVSSIQGDTYFWRVRGNWSGEVGSWTSSRFSLVSISGVRSAFEELTSHVSLQQILSTERQREILAVLETQLVLVLDEVRTEMFAFLETYEDNKNPLFQSENRVRVEDLAVEAQIVIFVQDFLLQNEFVNGRVHLVEGVTFEAASVFPGSISESEPRVSSAMIDWNGSYILNPAVTITASEFIVRPSGYWAAAGELVTVVVPQSYVDTGLSIIVGAHFRRATANIYVDTQNRFDDIGTEYPIISTEMTVANPFGGGIYLKVPDGVDAGWATIEIRDAVKSAFYSHVTGHETSVADWIQTVSNTSVPWIDLEADQFQTTMSLDMATGVDNPDEIMERWSQIMSSHQELAGRIEPTGRPEYYIFDRQLVTPAFGAGYPITIPPDDMRNSSLSSDVSHDTEWGTWNPFRVLSFRPNVTFLHEMGHNKLIPEMYYENGIDFNAESAIHVFASKMYNTLYGMSKDEAFKASAFQQLTMDETAMDWMMTHNFRNSLSMGHDPTIASEINDQIRYQHRGHAPFVLLGHLFGWDALAQVFGRFYMTDQPQDGPNSDFPFVHIRERWVEEASEALNIDLGPYFDFWGIKASPELRESLRGRFPQSQEVYDALQHFLSLVPENQSEFVPWYDQLYPKVGDVQQPRWDDYKASFDADFSSEVKTQLEGILSDMQADGVDVEQSELPQTVELSEAYPNPFNARTTIPFSLPQSSRVSIEVYDMLGRKVADVVDDVLSAGYHSAVWDASNLSAGVYIYRLSTDSESLTKSIILF